MKTHLRVLFIAASIIILGAGCKKQTPAQPAPQPEPTQKTYTNTAFGYQISYPLEFIELNAMSEAADLALTYPESYTKGTNLGEAHVLTTSHAGLTSPSAPKCLTNPYTGVALTDTVMQDGQKFYTYDIDDAGAGQRYNYRAYQIFKDNNCYTVMLQTHSSAIENYDPANRPKEYDRAAVTAAFDAIFKTFKFTK